MDRRVMAWALVAGLAGSVALGQELSSEDARAMAQRASERIKALQKEADALAARARTLFNDLRRLELDREVAQARVTEADAELSAVTLERDAVAARVEHLEAERVANTPGVAERLVSIYRRGKGGYLRLLLSSDDPKAFGRMTRGVAAIARLDRARLDAHRRTLAAEKSALADLEARHDEVASSQEAAASARAALEKSVAAHNAAIDALDQRRDMAARYVAELQDAQADLQRTVGTIPVTRPDLPFGPFRGTLAWPVQGPVLTRFGPSRNGRFGTAIVRNGIEIEAAEGTAVSAVHGGIVAYVAPFSGFGQLVILDHGGGAFTMYGHLASADVAQGARLSAGDTLGTVGLAPTGESAVYFEVRVDGRPVDPLQWLRSAP
ncbi:MAG: peptidoglycan DD-metalloendopeptidase family protein [Vicinamibacterales bacterium]